LRLSFREMAALFILSVDLIRAERFLS